VVRRLVGMRCELSRELLSASLDGELPDRPGELDAHLDTCGPCQTWAQRAADAHRLLRVRSAEEVPDLSGAILAADPPAGLRPVRARSRARIALAAVAGAHLALALPRLLARSGNDIHLLRHLGGWDLALAVGLLVAAAQPWRARGLLPTASTLGAVMLLSAAADLRGGGSSGMDIGPHVLEICGVAALWALARVERSGTPAGGDGGLWDLLRGRSTVLGLRVPWSGQLSASSSAAVSSASSCRTMASRARATRERTVPTGQSHTDAVSA
jgi:predicted anti-sigma-YlaC factor YlaD